MTARRRCVTTLGRVLPRTRAGRVVFGVIGAAWAASLVWCLAGIVRLAAAEPRMIPGMMVDIGLAAVFVWGVHRIFALTGRAQDLHRRVTELEAFQRAATAAGVGQQRELWALQDRVGGPRLDISEFRGGVQVIQTPGMPDGHMPPSAALTPPGDVAR